MLELRKMNCEDAPQQWRYVTAMPEEENGVTNPHAGVSFEDYLYRVLPELMMYENPVGMPDWFVPATYYYLWDDGKVVGEFRIRHRLTDALRTGAGHIGYSIQKEYRGRGYGTKGLAMTLEVARQIVPEEEICLRVRKTNPASFAVIRHNGGYVAGEDAEHYLLRVRKREDQEVWLKPMTSEMYHEYFREYQNDPDLYLDPGACTAYTYDVQTVERYIKRQADLNRKAFAIMYGGEMVGELIIKNIEPGKCAAMGLAMKNARYKDRGFGTRAEQLAVRYVFDELDIPVLYADALITNTRSQHVLEKVGFRLVRETEDFRYYCIER